MVEQAKQQQASQPDPAMVAAQGQLLAGQAELQKAQNEQAAIQVKAFQHRLMLRLQRQML